LKRLFEMKEESNILKKAGVKNPFSVPDGYFEGLTSEIMSRLPEQENSSFINNEPTVWDKFKPWVYMAAMFAGAAMLIRIGSNNEAVNSAQAVVDETELEIEYISTTANHSLMDDYSFYVYLAETEEDY